MDLMRENQADLLESNFSSVADSYDELPYDDRPIFRTHPGRMAANARLFGMNPPPVETARVLELGCAAGANIIPLAVFYPGAEFVGIDLGRRQIEDGVRRISGLGLANIELRCESITDLPHDAGSFDYIICHGVYSWVPEPVREAILALCRRHLSPNGVAYVSYNVLPGWRAMQPLRDALRALVPKDASIADRARLGRRLASYLAQMTPDRTPYGAMLQQLPRHIEESSDAYLFHEYMEDVNDPCLFSDFVDAAGRHRLAYLCETELAPMFAERFGAEFAEKLQASTRDDVISHEQMLDILSGNTFRTTLLVQAEQLPAIDRQLSVERLAGLLFLPSYLYSCRRDGDIVSIVSRSGQETQYDDPVVQRLIERLFQGILRSHAFDDLMDGFSEADLPDVIDALVAMVMAGIVILMDVPVATGDVGMFPRASALAQADARMGRNNTATRMHVSVQLDDLGRFLLPRLDGQTPVAGLEAALAQGLHKGDLRIEGPDAPPPGTDMAEVARLAVAQALRALADYGLLEA